MRSGICVRGPVPDRLDSGARTNHRGELRSGQGYADRALAPNDRPVDPAGDTAADTLGDTAADAPAPSAGRQREAARIQVDDPAARHQGSAVQPHRGAPDDAWGTRIQNRGIAASPYGPRGGVGPGGIGNHLITAHRLSSTRAFLDLPKLRVGAKVHLVAGGQRYTYRITRTRITSFRSKKSLAAQSAAVPGRPGVRATKAMITLSTCRTPEDRAEGNFWSDKFGNPEHRIDKIGVLVGIRRA